MLLLENPRATYFMRVKLKRIKQHEKQKQQQTQQDKRVAAEAAR